MREAQLDPLGAVRRFSASFDMTCPPFGTGAPRRLVGELRVTNPATGGFYFNCTTR